MNRTGASAAMTDYASDTVGRHAKGLKGEGRGMIKIFIGAILALLDITVTNGSMRFGILPDFIGCFLLYLGFKDIMAAYPKTCQRLATARTTLLVLTVYSAILYVMALTGIGADIAWLETALSLIYYVVLFYVLYLFLQSLYEIETDVSGDLKLEKFKRWWRYMSLFQVLICVLILVLCFRSASVEILFAYYVCAVMALVCEVLYLARLNGVLNTLQRRH